MKISTGVFLMALVLLAAACVKDPFVEDDNGTFKDTRDNQSYKWVRIGEQIWMAQNLGWLPSVSPGSTLSETEPHYYVFDYAGTVTMDAKAAANFTSYGALYNWPAARRACPEGWHLPSDAEWTTLTDILGGAAVAGRKMKSSTGWVGTGNGVDSVGFNALPAGGLDHKYGFVGMTYLAAFSSDTENSATTAWYRGLIHTDSKVNRNNTMKSDGYSVRCVKD